ncbi:PEP-CTERM sorting domain-containing protein [Pseudoduganella albidiflava]|uniref:PEP-CTERM sorting domain-containing protein n=1 Tax=Pseudoduganella albidiflava TaxID=321983 RepID=A0A411X400_9BURK|nr:PEP-CTERM sorting domain-containing protein [Pseudoduganella albidiflava]QBI03613.1 PEP-CTERM sorting domain-containing protein [Pseudoduganella albidiflava]GGY51427.1 hypothetical protein GCM10007387_37280 [Pseudoduganella albidiflava]
MTTKYIALLALALSSSLAQAESYTFEYKATINSITRGDPALPSSALSSVDLGTVTTSIGDVVTTRFTIDSSSFSNYDPYADRYTAWYSTSNYNVHFEQSGYTETTNSYAFTAVIDAQNGDYGGDSFTAAYTAYHYWPAMAYTEYTFELTDKSGQALTNTALDLEAFKQLAPSFAMRHSILGNGGMETIYLTGTVGSFALVSEVPEPSTYAMLAAGLCFVAWRRNRLN